MMSKLAMILTARGQLDEALALAERALSVESHRPGSRTNDVVAMRHTLARVLLSRRDLERAEGLMRTVVEADRRALGHDHPETIAAVEHLGGIILDRGRPGEARLLYRDNFDRVRRVFGRDSIRTSSAMSRLFSATYEADGIVALRDLQEHWLRDYLATPPENDPYWPTRHSVMISRLALWLVTLPEAIPFDEALALRGAEQAVALDSQWDWVYTVLGIVHYRRGDLAKAEVAIRASMERPKWKGGCGNDWWVLALIHAAPRRDRLGPLVVCSGLGWDGPDKVIWREFLPMSATRRRPCWVWNRPKAEAKSKSAPEPKAPPK